jgi:hypothetical protein
MFGVVVALPNLIAAFSTDVQTVQWVMTGYLLARVVHAGHGVASQPGWTA